MTAADYMMSFPLEALSAWDVKYRTPEIIAFLDQVHAKPGYVKVVCTILDSTVVATN